jgi:hypothetical protein
MIGLAHSLQSVRDLICEVREKKAEATRQT